MGIIFDYSMDHPHYTPKVLSEKLVKYIPRGFSGTIIDPACGAGNLLAAAAIRAIESKGTADKAKFVGIDIAESAVALCEEALSRLIPRERFTLISQDFLSSPVPPVSGPSVVLMNPPFGGYGRLTSDVRNYISENLKMKGRFNLSHAFVKKCIEDIKPGLLVALLPSNWFYSSRSFFRDELNESGGRWRWADIGDWEFGGVNVHVGVLVWRNTVRRNVGESLSALAGGSEHAGYRVRHGVATGADDVFRQMCSLNLPFGKEVIGVVGREIERNCNTLIWMPSRTGSAKKDADDSFLNALPKKFKTTLSRRSCVLEGRRTILEYHETVPDWFLGHPKLLVPEIISKGFRIELDGKGVKLPLHSVISICVPSIERGEALRDYLLSNSEYSFFVKNCPRLSGGAVRLNVRSIRGSIDRWLNNS